MIPLKYNLQKIEWVSKPGAPIWSGWVGEYVLFEVFKDYIAKNYTIESIFYTSLEKSIYTFFTFHECEQKAYSLLSNLISNLLKEEKILRIKLHGNKKIKRIR